MGGKSPGQAGSTTDPNPQPFMNNMRSFAEGAMKNLGPGFWGNEAPTFGSPPSSPATAAAPTAAPATGGATDQAAPAAPTQNASMTTTPNSSTGNNLAATVAPSAYWSDRMTKKAGTAPVTQT